MGALDLDGPCEAGLYVVEDILERNQTYIVEGDLPWITTHALGSNQALFVRMLTAECDMRNNSPIPAPVRAGHRVVISQ